MLKLKVNGPAILSQIKRFIITEYLNNPDELIPDFENNTLFFNIPQLNGNKRFN